MLAAIAAHKPALVFLAYPNNPTGTLYDADDMVEIIDAAGRQGHRGGRRSLSARSPRTSFMERLPEFDNLVVMRTVSKLGLAGIRLGYMAAAPALLAQFEKVRPPYNVNVLTQIAAEFALDHIEVLDDQADAADRRARAADGRSGGAAARDGVPVGRQFHPAAGARRRRFLRKTLRRIRSW